MRPARGFAAPRRLHRRRPVATGAHRTSRAPPHGPGRAPDPHWRRPRAAPRTQHGRRRPDHVSGPAPGTGRADATFAHIADAPSGVAPRRLGDRKPARQRPRHVAAHRCTAATCRPHRAHRIRPRACAAPHRLGAGHRRSRAGRDPAPTDDVARGHCDHTAAWHLPASFGIRRGSHRGSGSRCASSQGTHRGTVRRVRYDHLRTGGACPRRRMGRRCGVGIRAADRGKQSGPRGPYRSDAARPRTTAATGK